MVPRPNDLSTLEASISISNGWGVKKRRDLPFVGASGQRDRK